jgi:VanZ family protein
LAAGAGRRAWAGATIVLALLAAVAALLPPRGTPGVEVADLGEVRALILHFAGYAALALCAILAQARPRAVLTAMGLIAYATALEVLQGVLSERSFQAQDLVANAAGVIVGLLLGCLIERRTRNPR